MALSPTQEAQVIELINQQAALLSLAGNESNITSALGAEQVNLGELTAASSLADADLLLVRQGTTDKSSSVSTVRAGVLSANSVTTAKIADDAVTFAKLQDIATARVLGRTTAGAGAAEELTAAQVRTFIGAASATETGVVELATDAEAQAGTDATRAVTADNLGATVLGMGQTWTNVTGSRAFSTNYTNSTGRTIQVNVNMSLPSGSATDLLASGLVVSRAASGGASNESPLTALIRPGEVYRVNLVAGTPAFSTWMELR